MTSLASRTRMYEGNLEQKTPRSTWLITNAGNNDEIPIRHKLRRALFLFQILNPTLLSSASAHALVRRVPLDFSDLNIEKEEVRPRRRVHCVRTHAANAIEFSQFACV